MSKSIVSSVSSGERDFITNGIRAGVRIDGRGYNDIRWSSILHNVISSANGSSLFQNAENCILAVVKLEVKKIDAGTNLNDYIKVFFDCPTCLDNVKFMSSTGEEALLMMSNFFQSTCLSGLIHKKSLKIVEDELCWSLCINIVIFSAGGSLIDAASYALYCALKDTKKPKLKIYREVYQGRYETEFRAEVNTDTFETTAFLTPDQIPLCVTVGSISQFHVWDMTFGEEKCSDFSIIFVMDSSGNIRATYKSSGKFFSGSVLKSIMQESMKVGRNILQNLNE